MADINLDQELPEFFTQQYPSPEETIINNNSTLYKRKKYFLGEVRHSMKFIGFLIIIMVYLRDISMVQLAIRGFCHYAVSNPYPSSHLYTEESKKGLAKFLLISILTVNGFCGMMHLVFGVETESPSGSDYLYGGMTIEFIGERLPTGRLELFVYDMIILFDQLVLHTLMCFVDDSEVLTVKPSRLQQEAEGTDDLMTKPYDYSDGYTGDVMLLTIDLVKSIRTVMSYENLGMDDPSAIQEGPFNYRVPGGFHQ